MNRREGLGRGPNPARAPLGRLVPKFCGGKKKSHLKWGKKVGHLRVKGSACANYRGLENEQGGDRPTKLHIQQKNRNSGGLIKQEKS